MTPEENKRLAQTCWEGTLLITEKPPQHLKPPKSQIATVPLEKPLRYVHTYYMKDLVITENLKGTVEWAKGILSKMEFDSIAFSGNSGALIGAPLALAMNKSMIMVRKPGVKAHTNLEVEGDTHARRYIIVDDCVASGATARLIVAKTKELAPHAMCLGVLEVSCRDKYKKPKRRWELNKYGLTDPDPMY